MAIANSYVRARIDTQTKDRATDALEAMGLSVSDAIRMLMVRIASEKSLPFDIRVPNNITIDAIRELEAGKASRFNSIDDLMVDLNANN